VFYRTDGFLVTDTITCYLCKTTAQLIPPPKDEEPGWLAMGWTSPKPWLRGRNLDGDSVDFCCPDHKEFYEDSIAIGPPATRLLFKIFKSFIN